MTTRIAQNQLVCVGPIELSLQATSVSVPDVDTEVKDATVLANTGWKEVAAGLKRFTWMSAGFTDYSANNVDDTLLLPNITTADPIMVMPQGVADGDLAYIAEGVQLGFKMAMGPVGELHKYEIKGAGRGRGVARGLQLTAPATVRTTSGTGTARQLGAVSAAQTLYASLNVLHVAGTTPTLTVKVQSDDAVGFASPTDQITFTVVNGRVAEWRSKAGAGAPITDTWWRITWTITGTTPQFRFSCAAGIGT